MDYVILKNDRKGYGYSNPDLKCTECGCVTTRYVEFLNEDLTMRRLCPTILCSGCLLDIVDKMRSSLLNGITNE